MSKYTRRFAWNDSDFHHNSRHIDRHYARPKLANTHTVHRTWLLGGSGAVSREQPVLDSSHCIEQKPLAILSLVFLAFMPITI
jgi:hypothetical protein